MTARARRHDNLQQFGSARVRLRRLSATAAVIFLATAAALAARARVDRSEAAADALVAKLRDLPLPIQRPQHGVSSTATPPPLPDLEARRQQVYDELHALGPASVPALARALRDPDPEMRRDVAVALDVLGGDWWHFPDGGPKLDLRPILPALLVALRDSDPDVRSWVAQDISDIGPGAATAVPRLRSMLHSPEPESRGAACNALGAIGSAARAALPDLRRALNDSSPEVRQSARGAISKIDRAAALQ